MRTTCALPALLAATLAAASLAAGEASGGTSKSLFAAAAGSGNSCTAQNPCTLARAIAQAPAGAIVHVATGHYSGGYTLAKRLSLLAQGRVVLDASTSSDGVGIHIVGPGGSGSVVEGFIIEKATFEGILVGTSPGDANPVPAPVSGVTLRGNWVLSDNRGRGKPDATGECNVPPPAPADCGGGIHLVWTSDSRVEDNIVAYNSDGILLTDEFGPTASNVVAKNRILDNLYECGIVLAGHSPKAFGQDGKLTDLAGVHDNLVEGNLVRNNGVALSGAGVLIGGGAPGSAVYDNVVRGNTIDSNGHAGVTVHQHVAGYLGGNQILDNTIGRNNMLGDDDFAAAQDMQTTGIVVASGAPPGAKLPPFLLPSPIPGTVIQGNTISGDAVGIWTLDAPGDFSRNTFSPDVATPLSVHRAA
jgi:parallel beta-helix repeat protein